MTAKHQAEDALHERRPVAIQLLDDLEVIHRLQHYLSVEPSLALESDRVLA